MGGLVFVPGELFHHRDLPDPFLPMPLTAHQIVNYCFPGGHDLLGEDFHISEQEILDKSKTDWLVKALATVQIFWLLASVITRLVLDLLISQLEVCTAAFATLAVFTYAANWIKPKHKTTRLARKAIIASTGNLSFNVHSGHQKLGSIILSPGTTGFQTMLLGRNHSKPHSLPFQMH
jgi:hypothetical protein